MESATFCTVYLTNFRAYLPMEIKEVGLLQLLRLIDTDHPVTSLHGKKILSGHAISSIPLHFQ